MHAKCKLIRTDLSFKYSALPWSTVCRLNTELHIFPYFLAQKNNAMSANTFSKQFKFVIINPYWFLKGYHLNFNPTGINNVSETKQHSSFQWRSGTNAYCTCCDWIKPFPAVPLNQHSVWSIKHNQAQKNQANKQTKSKKCSSCQLFYFL